MSMVENIFYLFLGLNVAAGFWLVYGIVVTEVRRWRERGRSGSTGESPQNEPSNRGARKVETSEPALRGFDSPELFRKDSLIRLRRLQKEIGNQSE